MKKLGPTRRRRACALAVLSGALLAAVSSPAGAAPARPDLKIPSFKAPSAPVAPGAQIRLRMTTRNAGRLTAKASRSDLRLSRDAKRSRDDVRLARVKVKKLKPRRSSRRTLRVTIPAGLAPGRYRLLGCSDTARRVRERNERNNCRAARGFLTVGSTPGTPGTSGTPGTPGGTPATPPDDDLDDDGSKNADDCAPLDPAIHPGAADEPDVPNMVDANCDGIDGDRTRAIFVSAVGSDVNPGTEALPKRTIREGISSAQALDRDVYIARGTYGEAVTLIEEVGLFGGFELDWKRSLDARVAIESPASYGMLAQDLDRRTVVQHLSVAAGPATSSSASSYGVRAVSAPALVLERIQATGGAGAGGATGSTGATGRKGAPGKDGTGTSCSFHGAPFGNPGPGGVNPWGNNGGDGGTGGQDRDGTAGQDGQQSGQGGGKGGTGGQEADPGKPGGHADFGDWGARGRAALGGIDGLYSATWASFSGGTGQRGTHGHGGGGGGGGGGQQCTICQEGGGNGGGGGGGGGEGGAGGAGGGGGGGSFGIYVAFSPGLIVRDSLARGGAGGRGGDGGQGGLGGEGGQRGFGATDCTSEVGEGGDGGGGGNGGPGGFGGGGAGGPSYGLFSGGGEIVVHEITAEAGPPGAGGQSPAVKQPFADGQTGEAAAIKTMP